VGSLSCIRALARPRLPWLWISVIHCGSFQQGKQPPSRTIRTIRFSPEKFSGARLQDGLFR
jgi:hypothetical protein